MPWGLAPGGASWARGWAARAEQGRVSGETMADGSRWWRSAGERTLEAVWVLVCVCVGAGLCACVGGAERVFTLGRSRHVRMRVASGEGGGWRCVCERI